MWDITAHADRIENIKGGGSRSKKATLKVSFLEHFICKFFHLRVYGKVYNIVAKANKNSREKRKK